MTRRSFNLDADELSITVTAAYAKNGRERTVPLPARRAAGLREGLMHKLPTAPALRVPERAFAARVMRAALDAARKLWLDDAKTPKERTDRDESNFLRYKDDAGRHLDWHSMRHTRGVWLCQYNSATSKEVQYLMGLSSLSMVERYTRSFTLSRNIVEQNADPSLPPVGQQQAHRATGTHGAASDTPTASSSPSVAPAGPQTPAAVSKAFKAQSQSSERTANDGDADGDKPSICLPLSFPPRRRN